MLTNSRRTEKQSTLVPRIAEQAKKLREKAKGLPPGSAREGFLRKAREMEIMAALTGWITSPGLRAPE